MNALIRSVSHVLKNAAKAFRTFPVTIGCALLFAAVAVVRIELDWPEQESYTLLLDSLHWALALGAAVSLAAATFAYSRSDGAWALPAANLLGILSAAAAFALLYLFGGSSFDRGASQVLRLSHLAAARAGTAITVAFLAFIVLAGCPAQHSDFARSFFMTHKAFFIALLYGLVLMGGLSGVAGAVQALLYRDMSGKVYQHIGVLAGFIGFTVFVGYFPDFRKGQTDERREIAQRQPRFIEILLGVIAIPIMLALTAVLLAWAGKTVITGSWPTFSQLFGIAASFAAGGVWLHVMVTHYKSALAVFYRKAYPAAALVILAFEAWALLRQLRQTGLKTAEYFFFLLWLAAAAAAVLLLLKKPWTHKAIVSVVCALCVFSVLPVVGYSALPVAAQTNRLERLLLGEGMLEDGRLKPAAEEPPKDVRDSVTDAVLFLAYAEDARLPAWFSKELADGGVFKAKLGFEQSWPGWEGGGAYLSTYLTLPNSAADIGDYRWSAVFPEIGNGAAQVSVSGDRGTYLVSWRTDGATGIATLRIELDGRVILEQDTAAYIERISEKYPPGTTPSRAAGPEDMSLALESPEMDALLLFDSVSISVDTRQNATHSWLHLNTLYLRENP